MEKTKVTIYDVARKIGVSTTTVNRVLNNKPNVSDKTRQAVLNVIEEMNYRPSKTAAALSRSSVRINMILANTIFDFDKEIYQGAMDAYRDLYDFNLRGEVIEIPVEASPEDFCRVIGEQAEHCDALAIIPNEGIETISKYIDDHFANGKVRFCNGISRFFTKVPLFSVANNGVVAGGMAGELLDLMLQGKGKVAMFTKSRIATVHTNTRAGFEEYVNQSGLELCGIYEHQDKPEVAAQQAERLLKEHPDVAGIYIGTANSIPICKYLEEAGVAQRIKIVGSDIFEDLSEMMARGVVDASIFQNPYQVGKMMIKLMYEVIVEGKMLDTREFLLDPQVIVNSNKQLYMDMKQRGTAR